MATKEIAMPALSSTMKEGKIVSWSKKVGDKVSAGDIIMVVESDKADMDVESYDDGFLAKIITPEGGVQAVGAPVALIVSTKEEIATASVGGGSPAPAAPAQAAAPAAPPTGGASVPTININMPALSSTMKEGKIVSWSKKVGDKVSSGDVLLVVESDKADMDVESFEDGFLAKIITPEGGVAPVGAPVALLVTNKDDIAKASSATASSASSAATAPILQSTVPSAPVAVATTMPSVVNNGRVIASGWAKAVAAEKGIDLRTVASTRHDGLITAKDLEGAQVGTIAPVSTHIPAAGVINATPSARKFAAENNLDVTKIKGTGNFGRVTGDDVLIAAGKKSPPALQPVALPAKPVASSTGAPAGDKPAAPIKPGIGVDGVVAMTGMQKAVAKNMEKTLNVPIFRVSREIYTDDFDSLYALLKAKGVTVSSLLAKAVAETLKKHPVINAVYVDGGIKYSKDINVAMAVAIDGGLITPTIIKAQDQDLFSISRVWKELVEKAKTGKLSPAEYSSGTFYISNLGMFGVKQFDAILPAGVGSILSIAASTPKVVQDKSGQFKVKKSMTVTITCDHRHIYGADAAEFLKDLADVIENQPINLTMG